MPGVITVPEFIREAQEDYKSPTTSTFVNRIPQCRETVNKIDEVSDKIQISKIIINEKIINSDDSKHIKEMNFKWPPKPKIVSCCIGNDARPVWLKS